MAAIAVALLWFIPDGRIEKRLAIYLTELGDVDRSDKVSESKNLENTKANFHQC